MFAFLIFHFLKLNLPIKAEKLENNIEIIFAKI